MCLKKTLALAYLTSEFFNNAKLVINKLDKKYKPPFHLFKINQPLHFNSLTCFK